jgi:hypothetical protein
MGTESVRSYRSAISAAATARPSARPGLSASGGNGLRIVLFEACSAFTRVAACTLAL